MAKQISFSKIHGENVAVDKHYGKAKWMPERSGGWMFSSSPLEAGRQIHVVLDGSGHCDVGLVKTDPRNCDILANPSLFKKLNGVQIHKMTCKIPITLNREGTEVKSEHCGNVYKKNVDKKGSVWVAIYVKFGQVSCQLEETTGNIHRFSENHGTNIRMEDSRRQALTINSNPAAICFVATKLRPGETMQLVCEPIQDGGRAPSRFHLKLLACNKNPEDFVHDFRATFDTSLAPVSDPPLTVLEILEKNECNGRISIFLDRSQRLKYTSATNKQNNQNLNFNASSGVWIGFELYRVHVKLTTCKVQESIEAGDVVDARVREPRNEDGENSIDPHNSFVNHHLRTRRREDPYLQHDMLDAKGHMPHKERRPLPCPQTQRGSCYQAYTRRADDHLYEQNITGHPAMQNPIPAGDPMTNREDMIKHILSRDNGMDTIYEERENNNPRATQIPKPLTVPAPNIPKPLAVPAPNIPINQEYVTSTSRPTAQQYTQSPRAAVDQVNALNLLTSPNKVPETVPALVQVSPPTRPAPRGEVQTSTINGESMDDGTLVITDQLARMQQTLSTLVERVEIGLDGRATWRHRTAKTLPSEITSPVNDPIQKNWVGLVDTINAGKLCDHLFQQGIIDDNEREAITNKQDRYSANRHVLQLLRIKKVPKAQLVEIFTAADLSHLVENWNQ